MPISPDRVARGDRRRRLLIDGPGDAPSPARQSGRSAKRTGPAKRWSDEARDEHQPSIMQFVPQSRLLVAVLAVAILLGVAGTVALRHMVATAIASDMIDARWDRVASSGIDWLVATTCLIAAAYVTAIYSIRRYRCDDYHGRYRLWRWAALLLLVASADTCTGTTRLGAELLAGDKAFAITALLPLAPALLAALLLLREVAVSRAAIGMLTLAALLQVARIPFSETPIPGLDFLTPVDTAAALRLGATLSFLAGIVLYARRLRLEANGRIELVERASKTDNKPKRRKRPAKPRVVHADEIEPSSDEETAGDAADAAGKKRKAKSITPSHEAQGSNAESDAASDRPSSGSQTKQSKRRRRKEKRQRRRAA